MRRTSIKFLGITILTLCLLAVVFGAFYAFYIAGWDGLTTRAERQLWRDRIRVVVREIEPDLTQEQVLQIARKHGWKNPSAGIISNAEMRLGTPIEFGASNWILILTFSNGKLVSAKVRTEDDIDWKHKPVAAPEDIAYSQDGTYK